MQGVMGNSIARESTINGQDKRNRKRRKWVTVKTHPLITSCLNILSLKPVQHVCDVTRKVTGRRSAWFCFVTEDKSNFCHKHFNLGEECYKKERREQNLLLHESYNINEMVVPSIRSWCLLLITESSNNNPSKWTVYLTWYRDNIHRQ